jgi:hypothetical protein
MRYHELSDHDYKPFTPSPRCPSCGGVLRLLRVRRPMDAETKAALRERAAHKKEPVE